MAWSPEQKQIAPGRIFPGMNFAADFALMLGKNRRRRR